MGKNIFHYLHTISRCAYICIYILYIYAVHNLTHMTPAHPAGPAGIFSPLARLLGGIHQVTGRSSPLVRAGPLMRCQSLRTMMDKAHSLWAGGGVDGGKLFLDTAPLYDVMWQS